MTTGQLKKILAAAIGSPLVVGLAALPDPFGKLAAGIVGAVTIYVNWGHAGSARTLADYLRSVIAPELPQLLARLEALENPMIKDSIATLEKNLPLIKSAMAKVVSDEDAAKFDQLAADSQAIVDALPGATPAASASTGTDLAGTTPIVGAGVDPGSTVTTAPIGGVVTTTDPTATAPTVL